MASLKDFKHDISSLETEIAALEEQHNTYTQELANLIRSRNNKNTETTGEEDLPKKNITISPPRTGIANPYDDIIIPPPLEHEFFDVAITSFFDIESHIPQTKKQKKKTLLQVDDEHDNTELLSHINLENLYRLNGVTGFAINEPDLTTTEIQDLPKLGIRFDLFDNETKKFRKTHYIILKKNEKNENWEIFKKTIPEYVELDLKWLNIDLSKFTSQVRRQLLKLSEVDPLQSPPQPVVV